MKEVANATHKEKHDLLPGDGPPEDIYWKAVPIWCGKTQDEWFERYCDGSIEWADLLATFDGIGEEYARGYALGFEEGIVMTMLRPEWAQGFYNKLREYYLITHTEEDLEDWEHHADETTQAIPIQLITPQGFVRSAAHGSVEETA